MIDKERNFTPRKIVRHKNNFESVYTDHFSIEVILADMPKRKVKTVKSSTWNLGKPGGWEVYEELTNKVADKIEDIVQNNNIDEAIKTIDRIDNQIKFSAFGKSRSNSAKAKSKKIMIVQGKDSEKELLKRQSEKIEKEILKIMSQNLGRVGNLFK